MIHLSQLSDFYFQSHLLGFSKNGDFDKFLRRSKKNIVQCERNFSVVNMIIIYHPRWFMSWLKSSKFFSHKSKFGSHKWKFSNMMVLQHITDFDLDVLWGRSTRFWKVHNLYFWMIEISELLGTILGTKDIIKIHRDFANFQDFTNFHVYVDHPNGTQVVPKS